MPIPRLDRKSNNSTSWRNNRRYSLPQKTGSLNRLAGAGRAGFAWRGKRSSGPDLKRKTVRLGAYALAGLALLAVGTYVVLGRSLPDPNKLIEREVAQSTKILDRTGQVVLYEVHGDQKRTLVGLNDIPASVKNATIAIEDKDFYRHGGFSVWAMFRTVITNVLKRQKAGGSTLTQQFIKNAVFTNEKLYTRKAKELILAYRLEKKFSKDEILQMYLNEIPYGSTAYGVEAASQKYFGKSIRDVNLAEAAVLAALPQAPTRYSPYGSNKDLLIGRQRYILDLMVGQGYVSREEAEAAKTIELVFKKPTEQMLAPHFVMYVKEMLSDKYGDKMIESGGLKITTTLDYDKQKIAEEVIAEKTPKNLEKYQATNAALVSLDPKTGQILAMVGSKDYWNDEIDGQYNVTTSPRQPGSSFKPIVYAASFLKGYTPDTVLEDVVTNFSTDPAKPYEPHNYDLKERGFITIRKALAGSLNIPAVKAIYLTGINNVLDLADKLGYSTLRDRSRFGLSLVLGGGEVRLLEHAAAFSAFARDGNLARPAAVLKVEDKDGKILEEYKEAGEAVFEPQIARQINSILSDNAARAYIFGEKNNLTLPDRPVAAKTGTTNDYKDAWTVGYTPSLIAGVWVGNNDFKSMKRGADGSIVAAPIWHDFMARALSGSPVETFKAPEPVTAGKPVLDGDTSGSQMIKIDSATGLLATEDTPPNFIEEKLFFAPHSILYYVNKDEPRGPAPKNPADDPQFALWEKAILAWATKRGSSTVATGSPPTEYDNLHKKENRPVFSIDSPVNNQTLSAPRLETRISATAPRGVNRAEYFIDGNLVASVAAYPFNLDKNIDFLAAGFHDLVVRVCDDIDNCSEEKLSFSLESGGTEPAGDIALAWIEPSAGLGVSNIDFPLALKLSLSDPRQTAKVIVYGRLTNATSSETKIIGTIAPIESSLVSAAWKKAPPPGTYAYWAEAHDWRNRITKTEERTITLSE